MSPAVAAGLALAGLRLARSRMAQAQANKTEANAKGLWACSMRTAQESRPGGAQEEPLG